MALTIKRALVTGSSRGIGLAAVQQYLVEAARLEINGGTTSGSCVGF